MEVKLIQNYLESFQWKCLIWIHREQPEWKSAHLGFVNGAVQSIVLLVIQQTEVQGPQSGCERKIRRRERKSVQRRKKQTYRSHFIASNVLMKKSPSGTCQADKWRETWWMELWLRIVIEFADRGHTHQTLVNIVVAQNNPAGFEGVTEDGTNAACNLKLHGCVLHKMGSKFKAENTKL